MDSTTSTVTDAAKRYIDEALKQSPNDPQSNGYGFVVATLAGLLIILLVVVWLLYRDAKRDRKAAETERTKARQAAAMQIDGRFDKLEKAIDDGLDDIEKQTKDALAALQTEHVTFGQELTRLKTILELQKGR